MKNRMSKLAFIIVVLYLWIGCSIPSFAEEWIESDKIVSSFIDTGEIDLYYGFGTTGQLRGTDTHARDVHLSKANVYLMDKKNNRLVNHIWHQGDQTSSSGFLLAFPKDGSPTDFEVYTTQGTGGKLYYKGGDVNGSDRILKGVVEKDIPNRGKIRIEAVLTPSGNNYIKQEYTVTNLSSEPLNFYFIKSVDTELDGNDTVPVYMLGNKQGLYIKTANYFMNYRLVVPNGPDNYKHWYNARYRYWGDNGGKDGIIQGYNLPFNPVRSLVGTGNESENFAPDQPVPGRGDSGIFTKWNNITLNPNEKRTFSYDVGLGGFPLLEQNVANRSKNLTNAEQDDKVNHPDDELVDVINYQFDPVTVSTMEGGELVVEYSTPLESEKFYGKTKISSVTIHKPDQTTEKLDVASLIHENNKLRIPLKREYVSDKGIGKVEIELVPNYLLDENNKLKDENYRLASNATISINYTKDNKTERRFAKSKLAIPITMGKGILTLEKKDVYGQGLPNVTFTLTHEYQNSREVKTDEKGILTIENILATEGYKLFETAVPERSGLIFDASKPISYNQRESFAFKPDEKVIFDYIINQRKQVLLSIQAVDKEDTTKLLAGATLLLKQGDRIIDRKQTDEKGLVQFKKVDYGEYTIEEEVPPVGYLKYREVTMITPEQLDKVGVGNEITLHLGQLPHERLYFTWEFKKIDGDSKVGLPGSIFRLQNKNDQTIVFKQTSLEEGKLTFEKIPYGEYTLVEEKAPKGYVKLANALEFAIVEKQKNAPEEIENYKGKINISFKAIDAETKVAISSVVFELKQGEKTIQTAISNEDGMVYFPQVPYGNYTIVEISVPADYVKYTETISLDEKSLVDTNGAPKLSVVLADVPHTKIRGSIYFTKVDAADIKKTLSNAVFVLKDANGKELYQAISDEKGLVEFSQIPYGSYILHEKSAPNGYLMDAKDQQIEIKSSGQVIDLKQIANTSIKGHIEVKVFDIETKKPISDVQIQLKQDQLSGGFRTTPTERIVGDKITDQNGIVLFEHNPYGRYRITTLAVPEMYVNSNEEKTAVIKTQDERIIVEFYLQKKYGSVIVEKVDADSPERHLEGVIFALFQNGKEVERQVTNPDGIATFEKVYYGDYELKEIQTLSYYVLNEETQKVAIQNHKEQVFFTKEKAIKNKRRYFPPIQPEETENPEEENPRVPSEKPINSIEIIPIEEIQHGPISQQNILPKTGIQSIWGGGVAVLLSLSVASYLAWKWKR